MTGLYIHIPFCLRRCGYCDFCSSVLDAGRLGAYADAVVRNVRAYARKDICLDTVYFGGGTPSLLPGEKMAGILAEIRAAFSLSNDAEVTVEANPGTVDAEKLSAYSEAGVNRISFGIQSCKDDELYRLGRIHSFSDAEKAVATAKKCGIKNISADLMLGIPGQTLSSAEESVRKICELGISHLSAYMLKIEEGTPFDCPEIRAAVADDDTVSEMYLSCAEIAESFGLMQYEISNFARAGFESRHNLKYWTGEPYLGIGASAHSYFGGRRFFVPPDIAGFIASDRQPTETEDDRPDRLFEYLMLGLRLTRGIELSRVDELGGNVGRIAEASLPLERAGFVTRGGGRLRLTRRGFLVSNEVIARLIEAAQRT